MLLGKRSGIATTCGNTTNDETVSLNYVAEIIRNYSNNDPEMLGLVEKLSFNKGSVSDGYHTFNELYHHRAILFSVICNLHPDLAWKSKNHDDPNSPMYSGMFICGIETPEGQATYHYDINPYWDIFNVKELERAPKYDGHTPDDAINRIMLLGKV